MGKRVALLAGLATLLWGWYGLGAPSQLAILPRANHVVQSAELDQTSFVPTEKTCSKLGFPFAVSRTEEAQGKRVLITGVAGFIASHVARHCVLLGMTVIGVDDFSGGFPENIPEGITFVKVDVKNATSVGLLFDHHGPFDYVYHLAAYAAEGLSHFVRSYNYRNNLIGGVEILNQVLKRKNENTTGKRKVFIFASSIAVYGSNPRLPLTEEETPRPEDPYAISKYAMELDLRAAQELHGLDYIVFRPHNVYGPNQNIADRYRNVIGIFMNNLLKGRPMTVFGNGKQTRCFSFIDDVAPLIASAPLHSLSRNEVFNVGSDEPTDLNTVASLVASAMNITGEAAKAVHLAKRYEVAHAQAWHAKLRCFFNPPPVTPLDVGLRRTADWVLGRTAGFDPVEFQAVEVKAGMPQSWIRPHLAEKDSIEHTHQDNKRLNENHISNFRSL